MTRPPQAAAGVVAESKELIAGYALIEVASREQA
jgi:hypothetical protein